MPSNTDKYKDEFLVSEAIRLRKKHEELKALVHTEGIRHSTKVPKKREFITLGSVYTKAKEHGARLCSAKDKREAKEMKGTGSGRLRVVRVDKVLSEFLGLEKRGLPKDMYSDSLVTSMFTDWAFRTGRQNGREIKLFGPEDDFVKLFGEDLKKPGSGPFKKVKDSSGKETVIETSVLDADGNQINPFLMNKHMFIFKFHYPQKPKTTSGKYTMGRDIISKDDYPHIYERIQREREFLTIDLNEKRTAFKKAKNNLEKLTKSKENALKVGDTSIEASIRAADQEYRETRSAYIRLLNLNKLPFNI